MPRGQKLKIQWIEKNAQRQASFRKRRDTLIQKARELSILCSVPAAVVVYGAGEAEPTFWPGVEEVKEILQRYRDLPDTSKEAQRLDNEGFVRQRTEKMKRKVVHCKDSVRELEVNIIINDIALGRPREFEGLPHELTASVVSTLEALRSITADRVKLIRSGVAAEAAAALAPPVDDEAAALQEPLMVAPLAMVPPVVANAPLVQPAPPHSVMVVPPPPPEEEPPMVPPLAMMAPVVADAPLLLLPAPELEPVPVQSEELMVAPAPPLEEPPKVSDAPLLLPVLEQEPAPPAPLEAPMVAAEAPLLLPAPLLAEAVVAPQEIPPGIVIPPEVADALLLLLALPQEPPMVEDAPVLLPPPEPAPLVPELVVAPQEIPPAVVIPPEVTDALLLLLAPEPELPPPPPSQEPPIVEDAPPPQVPVPEAQVTAAGVGVEEDEPVNLDFEPRNGSFLLEVADAIIDDGTGRLATDEDVDRLLREHGLEHLKPPK